MSRVSPFSSWLLSPLGAFPSSKKRSKGLYPLDRFSPQAVLSYAINSTSLDHVQHFAGYMFRIVQGSTKVEDSGPITHSKMSTMHRNVRPNRPISVSVAPEMFAEHRKLTPQDPRIDTATAFHCPIGTVFSVLELVGGACTISHSIFHRHPFSSEKTILPVLLRTLWGCWLTSLPCMSPGHAFWPKTPVN